MIAIWVMGFLGGLLGCGAFYIGVRVIREIIKGNLEVEDFEENQQTFSL